MLRRFGHHIEPDWLLIYTITVTTCTSSAPEHTQTVLINRPTNRRGR